MREQSEIFVQSFNVIFATILWLMPSAGSSYGEQVDS